MQKIRIKKIAVAANALAPAGDPTVYKFGQANPSVSLPVEYEIEGFLHSPIKVGYSVSVDRTKRNGIEEQGYFGTTRVQSVTDTEFTTKNSIYQYEYID